MKLDIVNDEILQIINTREALRLVKQTSSVIEFNGVLLRTLFDLVTVFMDTVSFFLKDRYRIG